MKQCGLSSKERLISPLQFKGVYAQKRAVKSPFIWLYRTPNGLAFNRLGISVSNRLCVNLVQRNKIKKIFRHIFQCNKKDFGRGVDIVLVLKKKSEQIDHGSFKKTILAMTKR